MAMYRCSIQFPFFLTTPSSSTYLEHHHHQHLHWLDQLAHCQYQLQTTDQQCCINNGHCKQIRAFTRTCSLTHSLTPLYLGWDTRPKSNDTTQPCPELSLDLCFTPSPACSSPFRTRPQLLKSWIALSTG